MDNYKLIDDSFNGVENYIKRLNDEEKNGYVVKQVIVYNKGYDGMIYSVVLLEKFWKN